MDRPRRGSKEFYEKFVLSQLTDKKYIMAGGGAVRWSGQSVNKARLPEFYTKYRELDGIDCGGMLTWWYRENVDQEYKLNPIPGFDNIFIPTIERIFVDCILDDLRTVDQGDFYDTLERYWNYPHPENELYEVAEHLGLPRDILEYHINECLDYNSY